MLKIVIRTEDFAFTFKLIQNAYSRFMSTLFVHKKLINFPDKIV